MKELFLLSLLLPVWVKAADVAVIDLKTPIFAHLNETYAANFIAGSYHNLFIQNGQIVYKIQDDVPFCQLGQGPTVIHSDFSGCATRMNDSSPIHGQNIRSARILNFKIVKGDFDKCYDVPIRDGFFFYCYSNSKGNRRDLMLSDVKKVLGSYVTLKEVP